MTTDRAIGEKKTRTIPFKRIRGKGRIACHKRRQAEAKVGRKKCARWIYDTYICIRYREAFPTSICILSKHTVCLQSVWIEKYWRGWAYGLIARPSDLHFEMRVQTTRAIPIVALRLIERIPCVVKIRNDPLCKCYWWFCLQMILCESLSAEALLLTQARSEMTFLAGPFG